MDKVTFHMKDAKYISISVPSNMQDKINNAGFDVRKKMSEEKDKLISKGNIIIEEHIENMITDFGYIGTIVYIPKSKIKHLKIK